MLSFDLSDLFTEGRLGYVQSVGGSCEVQIFGQHNNGVQVAYFDFGKHGSIPPLPDGGDWLLPYI